MTSKQEYVFYLAQAQAKYNDVFMKVLQGIPIETDVNIFSTDEETDDSDDDSNMDIFR